MEVQIVSMHGNVLKWRILESDSVIQKTQNPNLKQINPELTIFLSLFFHGYCDDDDDQQTSKFPFKKARSESRIILS